mgnify:CR=1 FL=1
MFALDGFLTIMIRHRCELSISTIHRVLDVTRCIHIQDQVNVDTDRSSV